MKETMKKKIIKKVRDGFHYLGGFTFGYWFANVTGLFDDGGFTNTFERMVMCVFGLALFSLSLGAFYEFIMKEIDKERTPDEKDVIRVGIGSVVAAFMTLLPFTPMVLFICFMVCLGGLVYDMIMFMKKKK